MASKKQLTRLIWPKAKYYPCTITCLVGTRGNTWLIPKLYISLNVKYIPIWSNCSVWWVWTSVGWISLCSISDKEGILQHEILSKTAGYTEISNTSCLEKYLGERITVCISQQNSPVMNFLDCTSCNTHLLRGFWNTWHDMHLNPPTICQGQFLCRTLCH
jgi:hypothetical protein